MILHTIISKINLLIAIDHSWLILFFPCLDPVYWVTGRHQACKKNLALTILRCSSLGDRLGTRPNQERSPEKIGCLNKTRKLSVLCLWFTFRHSCIRKPSIRQSVAYMLQRVERCNCSIHESSLPDTCRRHTRNPHGDRVFAPVTLNRQTQKSQSQ